MTRWFKGMLVLLAGLWVGAVVAQYQLADRLPDRVPIHWDANMQPDGFVSRDAVFAIFYLMPTLVTVVAALLIVLPWVSPLRYKVEPFRPVYDYIGFLIVAMFGLLYGVILYGQVTGTLNPAWFLGVIFLFFGLMGNVLGKVRRNYWVGVRTPWTLASEVVWEQTHRLAAWLFVAAGLIGFALTLAGGPWLIGFSLILLAGIVPIFYSLVLYKRLERAGQLGDGNS